MPTYPAPRTWSADDIISASRLRADPVNLAWLLTKRPMFIGSQQSTGQSCATDVSQAVTLDTETLDGYNGHVIGSTTYSPPISGCYLSEGSVGFASASTAGPFSAGIQFNQNSVNAIVWGQTFNANGTNDAGPRASDIGALNATTFDFTNLIAFQNIGSTVNLATPNGAFFSTEWVSLLPSVGTKVTSPQPVELWPPNNGTSIANSGGIAAGATSVTVENAAGIVVGGTLGLDYYAGQQVHTYAETVTVTSVAGTTIGISATSYAHGQYAPVAVPVSAAFLNQQVRDVINFLAFPPVARLNNITSAQTLAAQTLPAGTAISWEAANIDTFGGWSASTPTEYVFPVSGIYTIYGQVFVHNSANNVSAGIGVSGGTILWGDSIKSTGSIALCATVRKTIRVTAGQYVQLFGSATTAAPLQASTASSAYSTLCVVWRSF